MPVPRTRSHIFFFVVMLVAIASARPLAPPVPSPYVSFGRGAPIVLLHGLGSRSEDWLPTARLLARHHRVSLVDLPGHGEADMPEPFSLERAIVSLDRSLAAIPDGPVILVGHSLGGLIAAGVAIERPERVRGLVLVETALRPQEVLHGAYLDFGRDSAQGEALYRRVAALEPRMVQRWIRLAWTADLSDRAGRLAMPVLAVLAERSWGADEPWPEVADALGLAAVPRLRPARLSGCGHFVMLDRPAELARLIAGFAADPEGVIVAGR